jgi:hypothetical protein
VQRLVVAGWIARAQKNDDDALRLMRAAADLEDRNEKHIVTPGRLAPAREQLGELLLEVGQPKAAPRGVRDVAQPRAESLCATTTVRRSRPKARATRPRRATTGASSPRSARRPTRHRPELVRAKAALK